MNEGVKFENLSLYEVDFKENEVDEMVFEVIGKDSEKCLGRVKINVVEGK
ncbi:hypothetical protein [Bacillus altitudinis]|nr:hypothetical protein [Bacillus altitudinis]